MPTAHCLFYFLRGLGQETRKPHYLHSILHRSLDAGLGVQGSVQKGFLEEETFDLGSKR